MSCYLPFCVSGVPYFPVLTKCGFEGQGGIIDCIQPINMSGINELLVSQGGSAMPRHHRERLNELETLLEFPPQVSQAELESRYEDLCKVLEKARDIFSCRVEEEQENPFQELRVQLQKAKDRFQVRLAGVNNAKPQRRSRFKTMSSAKNVQNPFQELRDAFRMARKHFIPLIDQYISTGNSYNTNAIRERAGSRLDGQYKPTTAVDINFASAEESSTNPSTNSINDCSKPRPLNACKETRTPGPVSLPFNEENAVDCHRTISSEDSMETVCVQMNTENAVDCCSTTLDTSLAEELRTQRSSNVYEGEGSLESTSLKINDEDALYCCSTITNTNLAKDCSTTELSNVCNEMSFRETVFVEINKDDALDSCTIMSKSPTDVHSERRLLNSFNEVSLRETSNGLGREEMPRDSFSEKVRSPHNSTTGRLEVLIIKELQRRKVEVMLLENQDQNDKDRSMMPPDITNSVAEVEAAILEQLSSLVE